MAAAVREYGTYAESRCSALPMLGARSSVPYD